MLCAVGPVHRVTLQRTTLIAAAAAFARNRANAIAMIADSNGACASVAVETVLWILARYVAANTRVTLRLPRNKLWPPKVPPMLLKWSVKLFE